MNTSILIATAAYFLALINPASKILFLSSMEPAYSWKQLCAVSIRSTLVAFFILGILAGAGSFLLGTVFHVQLYSLNVAGGIILFLVGLTAVQKGRFYETPGGENRSDVSIVPLAAPLIAGPGTITAAISYSSVHGLWLTVLCVSLALLVNLFFMLIARQIGHVLEKMNATGPLIRITGLIVSAVAVQMIFSGAADWLRQALSLPR